MSADIATLAEHTVTALAPIWPAVGAAAGSMATGVLTKLRDGATHAAGDATEAWAKRVVTRVFVRRQDGKPVTAGEPVPEDAVIDPGVVETLEDLSPGPGGRAARRLLARYVADAAEADPDLASDLRALLDEAPAASTTIGRTGSIRQANSGGVNVASTGVTRDINAGGDRR